MTHVFTGGTALIICFTTLKSVPFFLPGCIVVILNICRTYRDECDPSTGIWLHHHWVCSGG
jgi:hypothetical protein